MATPTVQSQIADLVPNAGVLANLVVKNFKANNTLTTSGVAVGGPEVDLLMQGGSQLQGLNFVNKVDTSVFNHSSDDYDQKGATGKITASPYMALRMDLNFGWAYTDLVKIITKYDVQGGITKAIPLYWAEIAEKIGVASMKGAIASDVNLTLGDGTEAFSLDVLIDAETDMDDQATNLFVSKKTLAKLKKGNINAYVAASDANIHFSKFADYNIHVTDAFGDDVSVIATDGALAFSAGFTPGLVPTAIKRDEDSGNGGGGEILRTRLSMVTAPQGMSYIGQAKPTLVQLAAADHWSRVADRGLIGFRAIHHLAS